MTSVARLEDLPALIGEELGRSDWLAIDQHRVDDFAAVTSDPDWMHIDVERARSGPVGQTIGQGFLTLSLLTHFNHAIDYLPHDVVYAYNYGIDRVRWPSPLRVGKRVRNIVRLLDVTKKGERRFLVKTLNTVEIEGEERPAMVAEWLGLVQGALEKDFRPWAASATVDD